MEEDGQERMTRVIDEHKCAYHQYLDVETAWKWQSAIQFDMNGANNPIDRYMCIVSCILQNICTSTVGSMYSHMRVNILCIHSDGDHEWNLQFGGRTSALADDYCCAVNGRSFFTRCCWLIILPHVDTCFLVIHAQKTIHIEVCNERLKCFLTWRYVTACL